MTDWAPPRCIHGHIILGCPRELDGYEMHGPDDRLSIGTNRPPCGRTTDLPFTGQGDEVGKTSWWSRLRWRYSPYWRGYRAGLADGSN